MLPLTARCGGRGSAAGRAAPTLCWIRPRLPEPRARRVGRHLALPLLHLPGRNGARLQTKTRCLAAAAAAEPGNSHRWGAAVRCRGAPAGRPAPRCGARWSPRRRGEGGGARARACCATRGAGNPGADKPDARWGETRARPRPGPWRPPPELVRGTWGGGCVAGCAPPRSWCPSHTCVRVSNPACKMLSFYFT